MKFRTLIHRSLRFHWRAHLGVVLGAAVGSAALIGALVVGDSVRESLRERALVRLGEIYFAMSPSDRLFRSQMANDFYGLYTRTYRNLYSGHFAAALLLPATMASEDSEARANHVNLIGVDELWLNMGADPRFAKIPADGVLLNEALAKHLNATTGSTVLLRVAKTTSLSQEAPITPRSHQIIARRAAVVGLVTSAALGDFGLRASPSSPFNAFVGLRTLQQISQSTNKANLLLSSKWEVDLPRPITQIERIKRLFRPPKETISVQTATGAYEAVEQRVPLPLDRINAAHDMQRIWKLADVELDLRTSGADIVLSSPRVFLDPAVDDAIKPDAERAGRDTARRIALGQEQKAKEIFLAEMLCADSKGLLTYLANLLRAGTNATPYSMVTAAGQPWTPPDMRDDEILVSRWLADDLHVKSGDEIALSYFDPTSGGRLVEHTNSFRVRGIVPMEMPWADRTLMPDFPGIEKAESTSDWDAGFPLTYKIRSKDEDYWKQYRGTPKAFITLAAGQKMWGNRFGNMTAIRFPIPTNDVSTLTPALSLRERENRSPSLRESETDAGVTASAKSESARKLSPLPAGEGQGEGELLARTNQSEDSGIASYKAALEKKILANLKPEELGLRFEPVREQALQAAKNSQDFGGLFLGFSFFLIAAALLLMAMLFQLGLEQRAPEIGTLLALGFTPKQVRRLLLREGVVLSLVGGVLGALGGLGYAWLMLRGLTTIWRDAVGATTLNFYYTPQTLVIGLLSSTVVCAITIWVALRNIVKRPARELLVGEFESAKAKNRSRGNLIGIGALVCGLGTVAWALATGETANAEAFFSAGALVLIAGLAFVSARLVRLASSEVPTLTPALSLREREHRSPASDANELVEHSETPMKVKDGQPLPPLSQAEGEAREVLSLSALGLRGCARRRKRSLSTVAMLACGSFLVVSIGVFRLDSNRNAWERSSGTGGFAFIGETTMPVVQDLNSQSGQDFFALNERDLDDVHFVPFRVHAGDEASCLNLNGAQRPKVLGVKPEMLDGRFAFTKNLNELTKTGPWSALERSDLSLPLDKDEIPAIGDANSIQWAMHKKVGDTIDYVDERGQPFKVRIVGAVANSILQGQLIIDEAEFVRRFPSESGYRMFLIDAPSNRVSQVSATLSRAMQDVGLELTPAAERLAQFNAVQNTYLGTFQVLGGLGLLLGSVGLGIVVLRNVLERRGELAVLLAVGFRKATLQRLLLVENGALLATGLALGVVAAAVAVLPALLSPNTQLPFASLALTLAAVLANGVLWTWAATRLAIRGDLLRALRNE